MLNKFIPHNHFKMDGIHILKDLLRWRDHLAKIDLKDAYFAVPIDREDRKYLRFRWGKKRFSSTVYLLGCNALLGSTNITKASVSVLYQAHHLHR